MLGAGVYQKYFKGFCQNTYHTKLELTLIYYEEQYATELGIILLISKNSKKTLNSLQHWNTFK